MTRGFSTLLIVVIAGSSALALVLWISTSSLWAVRSSADADASHRARALANACAEVALEMVREQTGFSGGGGFSIGNDRCEYEVSSAGGNRRIVRATGFAAEHVQKVEVVTIAFNPLTVESWREVGDF